MLIPILVTIAIVVGLLVVAALSIFIKQDPKKGQALLRLRALITLSLLVLIGIAIALGWLSPSAPWDKSFR